MTEVLGQLRWQDGLDISIIWYLIYRLLQMLRGSRAMQMIIGLAVVLMAYVLSRGLGLFTLNWILDNFLASIILVIIVIFQSDIRRALTQAYRSPPGAGARSRSQRIHRDRHSLGCESQPRAHRKRFSPCIADS